MKRRSKNTILTLVVAGALVVLPVSSAFADSEVTASNDSGDSEVSSGDASATNSDSAFVGHQGGDGSTEVGDADIDSDQSSNVQEGDNSFDATQDANSASGDTVGGQVIGGVVSGNLTVDGTNRSEDVDLESGDATSANDVAAFIGLSDATTTSIGAAGDDILSDTATNLQAGDNSADLSQRTDAVTGDAVGGQVFGAVTSGTTDAVLANLSIDTDAASGDADEFSDSDLFTGLLASGVIEI